MEGKREGRRGRERAGELERKRSVALSYPVLEYWFTLVTLTLCIFPRDSILFLSCAHGHLG